MQEQIAGCLPLSLRERAWGEGTDSTPIPSASKKPCFHLLVDLPSGAMVYYAECSQNVSL
ncbi:hypothetical protein XACLE20_980084 [Xanthomonas citri pv. citri]|nr:hypothetical protein XAC902_620082 [Xanthomonas citri pv. citri]CEE71999.1 hypothetical protein XACS584_800059 [Xanthomonas citri pv. citri]CEE88443.1 hypothetical protein XACLE20_980084 [Xanthomonas citri pv. citri]CEF25013.1 hypothetical protein XACJK2_870002 [Xanthomonas citri pv. citri]CEH70196.1 hypothetical protein XACLD7_8120004 [Xanthomonas citri pv. citri]